MFALGSGRYLEAEESRQAYLGELQDGMYVTVQGQLAGKQVPDPEVWQYNDDLKQSVSEMLSKTYGISGERVSQQLADVAGKLVADYWDNNGEDIRAIVDGSLLMDYDEAGVEMQFKSAAAISVTYTLLERCGIEPA